MKTKLLALAIAAAACVSHADQVQAYQAGDWVLRIGAGNVDPKSDNGTLAGTLRLDVGTDVKPTLALSYFVSDNWAAQVLAAWPFEHDFKLNGARSGSLKHLPPTVTMQYHVNPQGPLNFYVGAGFNYTFIYDEKIAIPGAKLRLGNSFGLAGELGVDYQFGNNWSLGLQVWKVDIDSKATLDGARIGTANVDPLVWGINLAYRF